MRQFRRFFRILGPGLITGAADDDPSGIATYSQTGAQFGYGQLWTVVFLLPFLVAVQETCARIGMVTGKGLAAVVKQVYGQKILYPVIFLVFIANTINIAADLGAMTAAIRLVWPNGSFALILCGLAIFSLFLEIFLNYHQYAKLLKWAALTLLAYPATLLLIKLPWTQILTATFWPHIEFSFQFLFIITGVFGTTISPYMFFWQASEEVEEHQKPTLGHIKRMRIDTGIGMLVSQIATWSIIVVAAGVLHAHGLTNIQTAADAAAALAPLAGPMAKLLFAFGVVGLGLLAVPVLAGSASYAVAEAVGWKTGLNLKPGKARGFYGVMSVATLLGLGLNLVGIDPIKALIFTAVFNGLCAVPLLFVINKISTNTKIMAEYKSGKVSKILCWITFFIMLAAGIGMFVSLAI